MIIRARDNSKMIDLNFSVTLNAPDGELSVIRALGADAGSFLQGQLTQDVLLMKTDEARLAAWCSAKGRMLASFIVVKISAEEFLLILSRDLVANTLKRLKMFVMRAKCELTDATASMSVQGLVGASLISATGTMNSIVPTVGSMASSGLTDSKITVLLPTVHLGGAAIPRALHLLMTVVPEEMPTQPHAWNSLEVASGIARLSVAVSEAFVPQMLNYESVGGVNFKKGCYPGQEVVARSQFRGTLKRRGYIVSSADAVQAGQEVFDSRESDQPCGQIAQAAAHLAGGYIAIVSMQTAAESSPALYAGSPDGALLQLQALPYALLADI
jgi:tRNA-modifying protein YgfZ